MKAFVLIILLITTSLVYSQEEIDCDSIMKYMAHWNEDHKDIADRDIWEDTLLLEESYVERWYECEPDSLWSNLYKGFIYEAKNDPDNAYIHYTKMIKLYNHSEAYQARAFLYERNGAYQLMVNDFWRAIINSETIAQQIKFAYPLYERYHGGRQYRSAVNVYNYIYFRNPGYEGINAKWMYTNMGLCYGNLAKMDSCFFFMRWVHRLDPEDATNVGNIGFFYSEMGEIDSAIYYLNRAIELDSTHDTPHSNLGYCYLIKQDYSKSQYHINKAIELDSTNSWAYKNMALLLIEQGKEEEACEYIHRADHFGFTFNYGSEIEVMKKEYCSE